MRLRSSESQSQSQGHLKLKVTLKEINYLSIVYVFVIYVLRGWPLIEWYSRLRIAKKTFRSHLGFI